MKSVLVALFFSLVSTVVSAETVGRFERFVWEESITVPANTQGVITTREIDTSEYESMVINFKDLNNQDYNLNVGVQFKLFEDDNFSNVVFSEGNIGRSIYASSWGNNSNDFNMERQGSIHTGIFGPKTRLVIRNHYASAATLRITVALIRPTTAPQGEQGLVGPVGPQGPQGIAGVAPEELKAMQLMIDQNRQLLEELPQLKKQIAELTAGSS